jgi:5-oxoprolinase (ATP-hydrolysing)
MTPGSWEFWIDVGGTFTDCCARRPDGVLVRHKLLSSGATKGAVATGSSAERILDPLRGGDPRGYWNGCELRLLDRQGRTVASSTVAQFDPAASTLNLSAPLAESPRIGQAYELVSAQEAPVLGVRYLLGLAADEPIPPVSVWLGTTRGTNALVTRRGARTALVATRGFGDLLEIGYQNRPRLFELAIHKTAPLAATVVEIDERVAADGSVLRRPDPETVRRQLTALRTAGIDSLAICLLHGYAHPEHERLVARAAREAGFTELSLSSEVAPLVKIVARGDTTVLDAYLNPVLRAYVAALGEAFAGGDLRIVTSSGGLVRSEEFRGKDSLLSGPAGGAIGFARVGQAAGFARTIGLDMGGTSTDVSRYDGRHELDYETERSGVRIVAPMLAIETVAAGGGSLCAFDGVKLIVGPDSAGADPGPACYGRGGPLTVTDLNFFLGKIVPEHFPFPLDRAAVEARLDELAAQVRQSTGKSYQRVELADACVRIANANMVRAMRKVSIARGCDPRDYVLVPFGGAAGQHACALARELGIRQLLCHPDAGLLSARGIGLAEPARHRVTGIYRPYSSAAMAEMKLLWDRMANEAVAELLADAAPQQEHARQCVTVHRRLDLRYQGVDAALTIDEPPDDDSGDGFAAAFAVEHQRLYGYTQPERALEIVAARVETVGRWATPLEPSVRVPQIPLAVERETIAYFSAEPCRTAVFLREQLRPGHVFAGPAIVHEFASTTVVDPEWQAEVLSGGELLLTDLAASVPSKSPAAADPASPDPALLEIFNNQFAGIAEQMGVTLRNTAGSVNVKERLDFSCAIFTAAGELVVNAPHIPVHLGAMGETVRRILADNRRIEPGDVFVTNDPYRGGSHLPDVTVVTPVPGPSETSRGEVGRGDLASPALRFFTASRAHHAEIGGIVPGSMPPDSRNLGEEGVLIRNFKLVAAGRSRFASLRELLSTAPYPSRAVRDNLADVAAQVAANRLGARQLLELCDREGWNVVQSYMRHIQAAAERKVRQALAKLPPGRRDFGDHLDDGTPIRAAVTVFPANLQSTEPAVEVDFTGTGPVSPGNLNANRAIVTAALMYVLRLLIDEEIPLNEGVLAPVRLLLPECLLNPPEQDRPEWCAAMAGGNVETSQRIVDVLLGAFGLAAASQGTMNNLLFGDATFGYYETICGGSGATAHEAGADAVQTHMTNTRLTDPEVLERRYPVRLHEFAIRRGSGGQGRHRGGNGVVRRLEFLRPLTVSVLSQRRGAYPPYGMAGGEPGALGRNTLLRRADGSTVDLGSSAQLQVAAGDMLIIETPGGGGWGAS